ncbi:MAG: hypothetical protein EBR82_50210 [Caulobacteraceae bacterium]|nr:hypothetical protein [Caulobacteraceae bacterium]
MWLLLLEFYLLLDILVHLMVLYLVHYNLVLALPNLALLGLRRTSFQPRGLLLRELFVFLP